MTDRPSGLELLVVDAVADDYEEFEMVASEISKWTRGSDHRPDAKQIEQALMKVIANRDVQAFECSESSNGFIEAEATSANIRSLWFYITEQGKKNLLKLPAWVGLTRERIDTNKLVADAKRCEDGAVVVFDGIVRNNSRGRQTLHLDYEAFEEMALGQMRQLAAQARERFGVRHVAIVHRLGRLEIGETSVLIVVASAHRAQAFDACRWLIDTLKQTVPIWKKETFADGAVWAPGEPFPREMAIYPTEAKDES